VLDVTYEEMNLRILAMAAAHIEVFGPIDPQLLYISEDNKGYQNKTWYCLGISVLPLKGPGNENAGSCSITTMITLMEG
jgi:hypothetical protein